jgi:hypothetical protein
MGLAWETGTRLIALIGLTVRPSKNPAILFDVSQSSFKYNSRIFKVEVWRIKHTLN